MELGHLINLRIKGLKHFCLVALLFLQFSCNKEAKAPKTIIEIRDTTETLKKVEIISFNPLSVSEQIILGTAVIDSTGRGTIDLGLIEKQFVVISLDSTWLPMYLEPGYNLQGRISHSPASTIFSGIGSPVNNYLISAKQKFSHFYEINGIDYDSLDETLASFEGEMNAFHESFLESAELPSDIESLMLLRNEIILLNVKQTYAWSYGLKNGFNLPPDLVLDDQIPLDSSLLALGLNEYLQLWHMNMFINYIVPSPPDSVSWEEKPRYIQSAISKIDHPNFLTEYLLAKNIDYWLGTLGNKPICHELHYDFIKEYPNSVYLKFIEEHFSKWQAISKGQPAPNITGENIHGDIIDLDQFKGNVVYIDIWATWCKPCVEEIPYSIALMERFNDLDSIVFLNISVDKNKSAWQNFVQNRNEWKGVHMLTDGAKLMDYLVYSYPRYMIVDKRGLVHNSDAMRPSNGDSLYFELQALLSE